MIWFALIAGLVVNGVWLAVSWPARAGVVARALVVGFVAGQCVWLVQRLLLGTGWGVWLDLANGLWHVALAPGLVVVTMVGALWRRVRARARRGVAAA